MNTKAKDNTEKQLTNFTRQLHNITCGEKTAVTDLSNKSGITEATIKSILDGATPSLDNAIAICQGLNVTLGFMLNEKNDLYATAMTGDLLWVSPKLCRPYDSNK